MSSNRSALQNVQLHPYLHCLVSKTYAQKLLPKMLKPAPQISVKSFHDYWMHSLSLNHRQQASFFAMNELVYLINKTNGRLLYEDLLRNKVQSSRGSSNHEIIIQNQDVALDEDDQYQLLGAFEMLWNINKQKTAMLSQSQILSEEEDIIDQDNILTESKCEKVIVHALTVRDEYLKQDSIKNSQQCCQQYHNLIDICLKVRKAAADTLNQDNSRKFQIISSFIDTNPQIQNDPSFQIQSQNESKKQGKNSNKTQNCVFPIQQLLTHSKQYIMLFIDSEEAELSFIKAIDETQIQSWQHFEYLLSFILENRFLRIYDAYIKKQTFNKQILQQKKEKIIDDEELFSLLEDKEAIKKQKINKKKKDAKKKKKNFNQLDKIDKESILSTDKQFEESKIINCNIELDNNFENEELLQTQHMNNCARKIQKAWHKFNFRKNELRSIIEDINIVDYTFRMEKMFDYMQIENENEKNCKNQLISQSSQNFGQIGQIQKLTKISLQMLDSYTIEEKLKFAISDFIESSEILNKQSLSNETKKEENLQNFEEDQKSNSQAEKSSLIISVENNEVSEKFENKKELNFPKYKEWYPKSFKNFTSNTIQSTNTNSLSQNSEKRENYQLTPTKDFIQNLNSLKNNTNLSIQYNKLNKVDENNIEVELSITNDENLTSISLEQEQINQYNLNVQKLNDFNQYFGQNINMQIYQSWSNQMDQQQKIQEKAYQQQFLTPNQAVNGFQKQKQNTSLPYPLFCNPILDYHPQLFQNYLDPYNQINFQQIHSNNLNLQQQDYFLQNLQYIPTIQTFQTQFPQIVQQIKENQNSQNQANISDHIANFNK